MKEKNINIIYIVNVLHAIPLINKLHSFTVHSVTCCEYIAACNSHILLLNSYDDIDSLIDKWNIDIVIASDLEYACEPLQKIREQNKCKAFYTNSELCKVLDNKKSFFNLCQQYRIPTPETISLSNIAAHDLDEKYLDQTYIIKPVNLCDGRGIEMLTSRHQLHGKSDYILQKMIHGQDYSVTCIANNGDMLEWIIYKSLYSKPFSSMIIREKSIDADINHKIIEFCHKMIRETNYTGFIGFDVLLSHGDGKPYFLECNPLLTQGITFISSFPEPLMNSIVYDTPYRGQEIISSDTSGKRIKITVDNYYLLTAIPRYPIPVLKKLIRYFFSLHKDYSFKMIAILINYLIKKHGLRYFSMALDREVDLLPSLYEKTS